MSTMLKVAAERRSAPPSPSHPPRSASACAHCPPRSRPASPFSPGSAGAPARARRAGRVGTRALRGDRDRPDPRRRRRLAATRSRLPAQVRLRPLPRRAVTSHSRFPINTTTHSAPSARRSRRAARFPPAAGQLQRYEAELRLRVDDVEALSGATKRAQRDRALRTAAASPRSSTTRRRRASARLRSRSASRSPQVQSAMTQLSAARHDRRPALRDRGSPGAGRQPRRRRSRRRSARSPGSWASSRARPSPTQTAPC